MAIVKLVSENNIGEGLHIEGSKLKAKIDGITIVLNEQGQLTAVAPIDIKLSGLEVVDDTTLRATLSDNTTVDVSLAEFLNVDTNTYPTSITRDGNVLKVYLNTGSSVDYDLTSFINDQVKGNEVQDLAGNTLGYFVKV